MTRRHTSDGGGEARRIQTPDNDNLHLADFARSFADIFSSPAETSALTRSDFSRFQTGGRVFHMRKLLNGANRKRER